MAKAAASSTRPRLLPLLLPLLLLLLLAAVHAEQPPPSPPASPTTTTAPGGYSSKGELPQMDFARLGAHKAATPSLCARVGRKAFFLCCVRRAGGADWGEQGLREEGRGGGGGLHVLAPGVGCLCQGHGGDVLAQVSSLRREAERYLALFGHPISARALALRAAESLQGKGQQTWSRPPACITVIAGWDPSSPSPTNGREAGAAEMYQLDPVGLVFPVKGLAFGGEGLRDAGGGEDAMGEALNAWAAEGGMDGGEREAEEATVWQRLWGGMVACYPSLKGREGQMECAVVSRRGGFRRLGRLNERLPPPPPEGVRQCGEAE